MGGLGELGEVVGMYGSAFAGTKLGQLAAGEGGSGGPSVSDQMNYFLDNALKSAISSSTNYTNQATGNLQSYLGQANNAITGSLSNMQKTSQALSDRGFNLSQTLNQPYSSSGYAAQDAYNKLLGLPSGNQLNMSQQDALAKQYNSLVRQVYGSDSVPTSAPTLNKSYVSANDINQYFNKNLGTGKKNGKQIFTYGGNTYKTQADALNANRGNIEKYLQDQLDQTAQSKYGSESDKYNQLQSWLASTGYDPGYAAAKEILSADPNNLPLDIRNKYGNNLEELNKFMGPQLAQQVRDTIASKTGNPSLGTNAPNGQDTSGLQSIFNSPAYQLAFGTGPQSTNPAERFKADPGYQFAIDEGMKQLERRAASRGLLDSGALQRDLLQYSQGTADQNYQRWLQQQMGILSGQQNQLANLAQFGASTSGSQNAFNQGMNLSNLIGSGILNGGLASSGNFMATGQDIASLLANQGVLNANAYLNTGAAKASGVLSQASLDAQMGSANANAQNQGANSLFAGGGAMAGTGGGGSYTRYGTGGMPNVSPGYIYF